MRAGRVLAAALVLAAATVAGCGGSDGAADASSPELVVFAAASLGPAFERYGDGFEAADVRFSFAGSDELAAQIRQGVAPDVYAAANTSLPEHLHRDGLIGKPVAFATNRLVVGVPAGSDIDEVSDLEKAGVEIAIGDAEVPVGIYTRAVLEALGPDAERAILANVASSEPDVAGIVGKLTQGAVDAGFIYRSDVDAAGGEIEQVPIPAHASPDVAYGIAAATGAAHPELAQQFIDGVVSGDGEKVLLDAGFGPPPR
ncbi:MAG: molybdate ABC transporter substrate-binding protein [Solirubrobacterales bacterium]